MLIAHGRNSHPLRRVTEGARCTWFLAETSPVTAWKKWISGSVETRGALVVDDGAVKALRDGKSLLLLGSAASGGCFQRGDTVAILGPAGDEIGRGLVAYDAADAKRIAGRKSREIATILGFAGRADDDPPRRPGAPR